MTGGCNRNQGELSDRRVFVLVLGTALVAGVLWLASGGTFQKKFDLYLAIEDESVAGLNLNAPVKYNGVDVGKVRNIRLTQATLNGSTCSSPSSAARQSRRTP